jgi:hypothetical protein
MSVNTFVQPDSETQLAMDYPRNIDAAISVLLRVGNRFSPHEQASPDMSVAVDPGHVMNGQTLVEQGPQSTSPIIAPLTAPRIDRIVIDNASGAVSVVAGSEAPSPVPPAIPAGSSPVAQVLLATTASAITNSMLTDERDFSNLGTGLGGLINVQTFSASGTYVPTPGTTRIVVEVQGGGGSGGGTAATGASTAAASSGGAGGAYAKAMLSSGFAGAAITVGAGGAAPAAGANNGNAGGASSFGAFVSCPGGGAGGAGPALSGPAVIGAAGAGAAATGGNIAGGSGTQGNHGLIFAVTAVVGGTGGSSHFGGGGTGGSNSVGGGAGSPGGGGGGSSSIANRAARSGGAGADGIVIVYEYA